MGPRIEHCGVGRGAAATHGGEAAIVFNVCKSANGKAALHKPAAAKRHVRWHSNTYKRRRDRLERWAVRPVQTDKALREDNGSCAHLNIVCDARTRRQHRRRRAAERSAADVCGTNNHLADSAHKRAHIPKPAAGDGDDRPSHPLRHRGVDGRHLKKHEAQHLQPLGDGQRRVDDLDGGVGDEARHIRRGNVRLTIG